MPNLVRSIGGYAFCGCKNLIDVYCYAENIPKTYSNAFDDSNIENATLHVPESAIEKYKTTEPWSRFGSFCTTNSVTNIPSTPILIQSLDGTIVINGLDEGTSVSVYDTNGIEIGKATATNNVANIQTSLQQGDIAIVKIGTKSVKVVMK